MVSRPEAFREPHTRPMTADDLDRVVALEEAGQAAPWSRKIFRDCLDVGYDCRMIFTGEEAVGFVILSRVLDEVHLLNIVVDRRWRGRGIASGVLGSLLAELGGQDFALMYLEVRESNTAARQLYEQLGFRQNGFREDYYRTADGGREGAVLMMKTLAPGHK